MTFWFLLFIFFLLALAIILVPLFRYRNPDQQQDEQQNIDVYKAQLKELETDQNNGLLSGAEAKSARLEIERRLLRIADEKSLQSLGSHSNRPFIIMVTMVILMVSAAFYLRVGRPGMPDFALKDQAHSVAQMAKKNSNSQKDLNEIAEINLHLSQHPDDVKAWHALGQYQSDLDNLPAAAKAFQHWYQLQPDNIDAAVIYAESLIMLSNSQVSPAALLLLNRARKIQPRNPGVRYYLALADYQAGNTEQALKGWKDLEAESNPNAPWLGQLRHWIHKAEQNLGIESSSQEAAAPALSEKERKAIESMSKAEQMDMIRSMVARLQGKMDQHPDNLEGWIRLAKAYMVLGQKQDAAKSLQQAVKYAPDDLKPDFKKQLEILLKQE